MQIKLHEKITDKTNGKRLNNHLTKNIHTHQPNATVFISQTIYII